MKIGIMGGTFDPTHNAHIIIARYAKEEYELDKVMFMTGGNPPHKSGVTDKLVPVMAVVYVLTVIALIVCNITRIPWWKCKDIINSNDFSFII